MIVEDLMNAMETIAPLKAAESWDKVGLQLGVPTRSIGGPILLTIDLSERVLEEALAMRAGAIVAYHPPIFNPLDRLTDTTHTERIIRGAAEAGIAIYSPHTALDATTDGVTDWLCEGLSAKPGEAKTGVISGDCRALQPSAGGDREREVKVITFVPSTHLDQVRNALGTAGAGGIGKYHLCSFTTTGEGTFLPQEGASPSIGEIGKLERIKEHRLEMVCSRRALPLVIETLKQFHPYEQPAYDIVELIPEPLRHVGPGRRLVLDQPVTMGELSDRLRSHLDRARVRYALVDDDRPYRVIGVVPGAGASLMHRARQEGCEVFITGEMTHHQIMEATQAGLNILLAGHTNTERGYLPRLASRLLELLPKAEIVISSADSDPVVVGH